MWKNLIAALMVLPIASSAVGCTYYAVESKEYLTSFNYAQPKPGSFRYVKRNLVATVFWDSKESPEAKGSPEYVTRMTSLLVEATRQLTAQANLGPNQALYNVRISAPGVVDRYFAWVIITAFTWLETRYSVTVAADVIELI